MSRKLGEEVLLKAGLSTVDLAVFAYQSAMFRKEDDDEVHVLDA
jgi:hypothetical protein